MRTTTIRGTALLTLLVGGAGLAQSSSPVLELISVSSDEVQGNGPSGVGAGFVTPSARTGVTPDGRFVGFVSFADNPCPAIRTCRPTCSCAIGWLERPNA